MSSNSIGHSIEYQVADSAAEKESADAVDVNHCGCKWLTKKYAIPKATNMNIRQP